MIRDRLVDLVAPMEVDRGTTAAPPDRGGLRVVSYNVELGGRKPDQLERDLRRMAPDVVCLQETSPETTRLLAQRLGLHYALYRQRGPIKGSLKAVLSRYPIVAARDHGFGLLWQRVCAFFRKWREDGTPWSAGEPLEGRSALEVQLQVGKRRVDVLDTHLSLYDAGANAEELRQLTALARRAEARGETVVVAGDFNANMALLPGGVDAEGTPTDTPAEFSRRYAGAAPGNVADPRVAAAGAQLCGELQGYWTATDRRVLTDEGELTPEQALAALPYADPARAARLRLAADGVSHLGARKRFDNILVSRDAYVALAAIDQTTRASDHQPVLADLRWRA
jgi:endonuclease/exonuclease/phosphatase family metal-dependent hydrolase